MLKCQYSSKKIEINSIDNRKREASIFNIRYSMELSFRCCNFAPSTCLSIFPISPWQHQFLFSLHQGIYSGCRCGSYRWKNETGMLKYCFSYNWRSDTWNMTNNRTLQTYCFSCVVESSIDSRLIIAFERISLRPLRNSACRWRLPRLNF